MQTRSLAVLAGGLLTLLTGPQALLAQSSWTAGDIGSVTISGSASYDASSGSYSLISSGNGLWGSNDAFEFMSQEVSGDMQITAHLVSQQEDDPWAKAGLMLRQNTDPASLFAFGFLTPSNGVNFQSRLTLAGSPNFQLLGAGVAPKWLRLIRSGQYVIGYRSEDGLTWDHPTAEQIGLDGQFLAGIAATSRKESTLPANALADYRFDDASGLAASDSSGNSHTATLNGAASWTNGKVKGALNLNGSTNTYVSLPSNIVTGVDSITIAAWVKWYGGNNWQRIFDFGNGTGVYMFLTPKSGYGTMRFAIKSSASGNAEQIMEAPALPVGIWKHLAVTISSGSTTSTGTGTLYVDGVQVAQNTAMSATPSSLGATYQNWIGRSQYSGDAYFGGQIDEFKIYNRVLTASELSSLVVNSQIAYYRFIETSGTTAADSSGNGMTATLRGNAGWQANALDLGGSNAYASLPTGIGSGVGDFTVSTWVKWYGGNMWQRIFDFGTGTGLYMYLTPYSGINTLRFGIKTPATGNIEKDVDAPTLPVGVWKHVAITKRGNTATLYMDGAQVAQNTSVAGSLSELGASTQNWIGRSQFSSDPYLDGLVSDFRIYSRALSSAEIASLGAGGTFATTPGRLTPPSYGSSSSVVNVGGAVFDNVVVSATTQVQFGALPRPWSIENIGATSGASAAYDPTGGTFLISGSGGALASGSDSLTFLHRTWYGDGDFIVRVADLPNAAGNAQAGIALRESTNPANPLAACANLYLNSAGEAVFSVRSATSGSTTAIGAVDLGAPGWLKLDRSGNVLRGYASLDGNTWSLIGSATVAMQSQGELGLTMASSALKPSTTVIFDNLSLSGPDGNGNGLLDAWEMAMFGNLKQSATADPDGDGLTNAQEQALGTNPLVGDSEAAALASASTLPIKLTSLSKPGMLEHDVWLNVSGTNVCDLTHSAAFAGAPDVVDYVTSAASPVNYAENFGQRLRGTITAPVTGNYTFWISADDSAELWLGTSESRFTKRLIASVANCTSVQSWDIYPSQKSITVTLQAGQKYWIEALHKEAGGNDHVEMAWQYPGQTRQVIPGQYLASPAFDPNDINDNSLPDDWEASYHATGGEYGDAHDAGLTNFQESCLPNGALEHDVWLNIPGCQVGDLTRNPAFAGAPDVREHVTSAASPVNYAENFGQRLRGLVTAPVTGDYTFWICADDTAELWLGTTASRFSKRRIAFASSWTDVQAWDATPSQRSLTVTLQAGQQYWIEALAKEATGGDHVEIAWQVPGQARQIIPGQYLSAPGIDPNDLNDNNLPDDWETANNVTGGEYGDPDNDGLTNFEEYRYGTNPMVAGGVQGYLSRDLWTGIGGNNVSSLTLSPAYLLTPTQHELWAGGPCVPSINLDNYGQRLRGTVTAPVTGYYTFWIAADDCAELWLSSDSHKFQKKRIAHCDSWKNVNAFDDTGAQKSALILLQAGQSYYVEILHKEIKGGDHVEVAWQKPGGSREAIPAQYLTSYVKDSDDQDDDDMPDSWERLYGLDPTDNGSKDLKQASYSDYDGDGISNRDEYLIGTNPCKADTDGDGINDYDEAYVYGSDPMKSDIAPFVLSQSVAGNAFTASSGQWTSIGTSSAVSVDRRGSVDYPFTVATDGYWRFEVSLKPLGVVCGLNVSIPVEILVDGVSMGSFTMNSYNGAVDKLRGYTQKLQAGQHTLRLINRNPSGAVSLEVDGIAILQPQGVDENGDGVPDWIANEMANCNTLDPLSSFSYTSPVCVEGKTRFIGQTSVVSGTSTIAALAQPWGKWYANIPLNADGSATEIGAEFTVDAIRLSGTVSWRPFNVTEGANTTLVIRKDDSLRLTAFPVGTDPAGTVDLTIMTGTSVVATSSGDASQPYVYQFPAAGVYTIQTVWNGTVSSSCTVQVEDGSFGDALWAYVGSTRDWLLPSIDTSLYLAWDNSLSATEYTPPETGGRKLSLTAMTDGQQYIVARLSPQGPILARGIVQVPRVYNATQTGDTQILQEYPNGDKLIRSSIVVDDLPQGGYVMIHIFIAGATFEDGTVDKKLTAADFVNGVAYFNILTPKDGTHNVCHTAAVYDSAGNKIYSF